MYNPKEEPTLTTKNVMDTEVRVVSQPPVAEAATAQPESEFMKTATPEDIATLEQIGDDFMHEAIVAKPLNMPEYLNLTPKDSSVAFRWINHKAQEAASYFRHLGMGFAKAQPEDVKENIDTSHVRHEDGGLICGDVVLMKCNKLKLFAAYKANVLRANRMAGSENVHAEALAAAQKQFSTDVPQNSYVKSRVKFYKGEAPMGT